MCSAAVEAGGMTGLEASVGSNGRGRADMPLRLAPTPAPPLLPSPREAIDQDGRGKRKKNGLRWPALTPSSPAAGNVAAAARRGVGSFATAEAAAVEAVGDGGWAGNTSPISLTPLLEVLEPGSLLAKVMACGANSDSAD